MLKRETQGKKRIGQAPIKGGLLAIEILDPDRRGRNGQRHSTGRPLEERATFDIEKFRNSMVNQEIAGERIRQKRTTEADAKVSDIVSSVRRREISEERTEVI